MKITKQQLRQIIKEEILQERNDEKVMQLLAAAVGAARDQLKKSNRRRGDLQPEDVQSVLDQYKESFNKNIKEDTVLEWEMVE